MIFKKIETVSRIRRGISTFSLDKASSCCQHNSKKILRVIHETETYASQGRKLNSF